MDQKTKIKLLAKKSNTVLNKKWFLYSFIFALLSVTLFQMIMFGLGNAEFAPYPKMLDIFNLSQGAIDAVIWVLLVIGIPGTIIGAISTIALSKKEKRMFPLMCWSYSLFIITSLLSGLYLDVIKFFIIIMLVYPSYKNWDKVHETKLVVKKLDIKHLVLVFMAVLAIIGTLGPSVYYLSTVTDIFDYQWHTAFLDASVLTMTLVGFMLISRNYIDGYLVFFISNVCAITLFIISGLWTIAVIYFIYIIIDTFGTLNWFSIYIESK